MADSNTRSPVGGGRGALILLGQGGGMQGQVTRWRRAAVGEAGSEAGHGWDELVRPRGRWTARVG